jgi:superfamily II DNA or RNA helicase
MSYSLFNDQVSFINNIRPCLSVKKRVIACAATGFGKSKVFISIATSANAKGKTVLILTESTKIFNQIKAELPAVLINPESKHIYLPVGGIYIAMAQTLARRKELIEQLQKIGDDLIVIIDECHVGHFTKILEQLNSAFLLGFTATPDARWAKHLPLIYKDIVIGPQPHELVLNSRLTPYKHYARVCADTNALVLQNGEFTEESQEYVFGASKVFDGLLEDLRKIPYKKCLVFCPSIKSAESLSQQISASGIPSVAVHSKLSVFDQSFKLGQFTKGDLNVCVSVGSLTKGFDFPPIDLVVLFRATTSLPLYLQMLGRGSRVLADELFKATHIRTKKFFTVLDYGGNYIRHGLWDAEREWQDLWNQPKKSKEGVAPIRVCPECEFITKLSATNCPNCGYEFMKKDVPLEVGKLVEITEIYTNQMVGKRISELTAEQLSIYAKLKAKKNFANRVARALNKRPDREGYLKEYAEFMGYKPGWIDYQEKMDKDNEVAQFTDLILR